MGRPKNKGLSYYPQDTNIHADRKIKRLLYSFNANGYLVYEYVKCLAYHENGYYVQVDANFYFDVAYSLQCGLTETLVNDIILHCVLIDLFDSDIFTKHKVLTSSGIQKRFKQIMKRGTINPKYLILTEKVIKCETPSFAPINPRNDVKNPPLDVLLPQGSVLSSPTFIINNIESSIEGIVKEEKNINLSNNNNSAENGLNGAKPGISHDEIHNNGAKPGISHDEIHNNGAKPGISHDYLQNEVLIDINKAGLIYSIEQCAFNFSHNPAFSRTKEQAIGRLFIGTPMEEVETKLSKWALAFNRKLISEGCFEMKFTGHPSWSKYFPNWVNDVKSTVSNPDTLYAPDVTPELTIAEKKEIFKQSLDPFVKSKQYDGVMMNEFYQHYGEVMKDGKTLKWETYDAWELPVRLAKWKTKAEKFEKQNQ